MGGIIHRGVGRRLGMTNQKKLESKVIQAMKAAPRHLPPGHRYIMCVGHEDDDVAIMAFCSEEEVKEAYDDMKKRCPGAVIIRGHVPLG